MAKVITPRNGLSVIARQSADYPELVDSVYEIARDLIDCNGDSVYVAVRAAIKQINDEYMVLIYADAIEAVKMRLRCEM